MGVSYETDPQSNMGWIRDKFAAITRRLDESDRAARLGAGRSGAVAGGLIVVTPHSNEQGPLLQRRAGAVYCGFRVLLGGAVAADGVVATLPAGFKPPTTMQVVFSGVKRAAGAWGTQAYWIQPSDGTIRLLGNGLASGDLAAAQIPPFLAGA